MFNSQKLSCMMIVPALHHPLLLLQYLRAILPALLLNFNLTKNSSLHPFSPSLPVFSGFISKAIVNHGTYHFNCCLPIFCTSLLLPLSFFYICLCDLNLEVPLFSSHMGCVFAQTIWGALQAALLSCLIS